MSFRLFVYYSAVCAAWAAFAGWALGRLLAPSDQAAEATYGRAITQGVLLGLLVAFAAGLVDALWNRSGSQSVGVLVKVFVAVAVGCLGGLVGAGVGQFLVNSVSKAGGAGEALAPVFVVLGWTLTGLAVGASVGVYDILAAVGRRQDLRGAVAKLRNGALGGVLGGLVGGVLYTLLPLFARGKDLLTPSAVGFVALGLSIGLLIGLAQVILKEAWVRVESGFRAGRELILSKAETVIGRAESCDVGLFGDNRVERAHARIRVENNRYVLADAGTPAGTFLNGERVTQPTPLKNGDAIQVGNSVLRFGERQKRRTR
jgi:hypothetical protein